MQRARRSFWLLFLVAVAATGGLSWSLSAPKGPLAAAVFALSAGVLAVAVALDLRILAAWDRRRGR